MKKIIAISTLLITFMLSGCQLINTNEQPHSAAPEETKPTISLDAIEGAVVHIDCPLADNTAEMLGTGTIINDTGLIITNAHVIPHDDSYLNTDAKGCVISLPDPKNGGMINANQIYLARPKVIKDIGDKYDLATLQIYDVADSGLTKKISSLPTQFPSFDITKGCAIQDIKLGEKIHIYGYPDSGDNNLSLTLTDGVVSSFPGSGYIQTDAKLNHGNSGGLAVDDNGCFIGIPESVYQGELASYGYIISTDLISKFQNEAKGSSETLKDESGKTRLISRTNIEQYYENTYFIKFNDTTKETSNLRESSGQEGDQLAIVTEGNNDNDLEGATIAVSVNSADELDIKKTTHLLNEFTNLIDNRILTNDDQYINNMLVETVSSSNRSTTKEINGITITMQYTNNNIVVLLFIPTTKLDLLNQNEETSTHASANEENLAQEKELFTKFFGLIDQKQFETAYTLFSDKMKAQAPFETWKEGYKNTISNTINNIECANHQCNVSLTAAENVQGIRHTNYLFQYNLTSDSSGNLLIDSGRMISNSPMVETTNNIEPPIRPKAFIKISDAKPTRDQNGTVNIRGTTSSNCTKIVVHAPNTKTREYDDYQLKKYQPGATNFVYSAREDLYNLGSGENDYTFTAYCGEEQVSATYQLIVS